MTCLFKYIDYILCRLNNAHLFGNTIESGCLCKVILLRVLQVPKGDTYKAVPKIDIYTLYVIVYYGRRLDLQDKCRCLSCDLYRILAVFSC